MEVSKVKDGMLKICRQVSGSETRHYVRDKAGKNFMTLDFRPRRKQSVFVEISAQRFKNNFARCSEMVRLGVHFKLSLKGGATVYARRHSNYHDACDDMIEEWQTKTARSAGMEALETKIIAEVKRVDISTAADLDWITKLLSEIKLGMARKAIGHRPFEEGTSQPGDYDDDTQTEED